MKICAFIVDDEKPIVRAFLTAFIGKFVITSTTSAEDALEVLLGPNEFDVVILDLMLNSGLSGAEIYEQLETQAPARCDRVVFFTATVHHEIMSKWLAAKHRPILPKPSDIGTIELMILHVAKQTGSRGPHHAIP